MKNLILIDYQNLFKSCQKREIQIDEIMKEILKRGREKGEIVETRLFVPNYQHTTSPWRLINHLQLAYGVSVETCPVLREEGEEEFKDLVDGIICSWVTRYLQPDIGPELIIFVSGDGHLILAGNEARRRKKEVEFWILDPEMTSQSLLKYFPFEKLEQEAEKEDNPFALALIKRLELKSKLNEEERERIKLLKKIQIFLSSLPILEINSEMVIEFLTQKVKEILDVKEEEIRQALNGFIRLGVIRIHPAYSINRNSSYFQWLEFFEELQK